jgi:DNA-binding MarR family transcriptional regulator
MIMNSLFADDGQHASVLANSVGRAATSFTPILDRLQKKGYVERRSDSADRRAVKIFITKKGHANKDRIDALNPAIQNALAKYCEENNLGPVWALFVKAVTE